MIRLKALVLQLSSGKSIEKNKRESCQRNTHSSQLNEQEHHRNKSLAKMEEMSRLTFSNASTESPHSQSLTLELIIYW